MRSRFLLALRDDWRVLVAAVLGLSVLAVLVTVAIVLVTRPAAPAEGDTADERPPGANAQAALPQVRLDDFAVPHEGRRLENWSWERFRTPGRPWDKQQVDRFWVDPGKPALEYLGTRNDKEIERILQNVP